LSTKNVLTIDQGTTNTKVILVNAAGEVAHRASRPLDISYPQPAWVEQDPMLLWQSVREAIDECLQSASSSEIAAIAISNQRESVVLWERESGQAVGPCVVWQCQRGAEFCRQLTSAGLETTVRARTGLTIDPMFSGSKMRWLLENSTDGYRRAAAGELCLGTVDSWLLFNLTGGKVHACDVTNASRTLLFDLHKLRWDPECLDLFGIPAAVLPQVHASGNIFGETVALGNLPAGVPIASLIGDSHAALFGHAGFKPGAIKATYGTGSSLMTPTRFPVVSQKGLSTTLAWGEAEQTTYALEGNIYATGAAVQWLGQLLGLNAAKLTELAASIDTTEGVYMVPAFVGLGAPHWNDRARGLLSGLTRGSGPAHLARATIESIAYQIRDVFDVMQAESGSPLKVLLADGGASQNDLLMQFQADIIGCPVLRSLSTDVSALGAAYLAGLTVGLWRSHAEIEQIVLPHDRFEPHMSGKERALLYEGWQDAIARAKLDTSL
jgi:glycerol kinase